MKHDKLIDHLGGYAVLATKVKRNPSTTFRWWQNASIPPEYWAKVADLAKRQGLPDVDLASLARTSPTVRKLAS